MSNSSVFIDITLFLSTDFKINIYYSFIYLYSIIVARYNKEQFPDINNKNKNSRIDIK